MERENEKNMEKNDADIVTEILAGNHQQFEVIVDRYMKPLYGFVFRVIGDGAAAEDVVQDVFVKTWKNLEKFDAEKKFSTWIFAIAKNAAFDYLKKKKTFPFAFFAEEDGATILEYIEDERIMGTAALLGKIDDRHTLEAFLNELPVKSKSILLLYCIEGFSLSEIAQMFGSSQNTIKSIYRRSILTLRSKMMQREDAFESN